MEILDTDLLPPAPLQTKNVLFIKRKLYIFLLICTTASNLLFGYLVTEISDAGITKFIAFLSSFIIICIFGPIVSAIAAVVFAILPYKGQRYKQKYLPVTLLIYLLLNVAVLSIFLAAMYITDGTLKL